MKTKQVYSNIIALFFVQFANYVAPILVLPYLTRILGVDGYGSIVLAMSICSVSLILTDYGFNLSASYWISKNRDDKDEVSRYIGAVFIIKILLVLIWLGCFKLFSINGFISIIDNDMFNWIVFNVLAQTFQAVWFFQGIEKMKNVTIFMVIAKISYLFMIFLFIRSPGQEVDVLTCLSFSNLLSAVISIYLMLKTGYRIKTPNIKMIIYAFKCSSEFFLSRAAVGIYTSASTLIVGSFAGVQQAAFYSCAEKLYQAGQGIMSPVSQALFPYLSRTGDKKILYKCIGMLSIPLMIGCFICGIYSKEILGLFYGNEFTSANLVLEIFLACSVITFISINFGYPAFSIIGRLDLANKSVFVAAILQLVIIFILIYIDKVSAINIAISVLFVELIVMMMRGGLFLYHVKSK